MKNPVLADEKVRTQSESGAVKGSSTLCQAEIPPWTNNATTGEDCTFHQLAPYIGRVKTTIAGHLVEQYTKRGHLVVDPFCGSGVIPLEAAYRGREVLGGDINPYAVLLARAKLTAPRSESIAMKILTECWQSAKRRVASQDLRKTPAWVRAFFHPETLRVALALRDELVDRNEEFLLGCLLGILHHQRPGFLSYPSSHLVPYLRDKRFPRAEFPELYGPRDVYSRMGSKVHRMYRRPPPKLAPGTICLSDCRELPVTRPIQAVITSPPYMNELDYVRDNRLRLWFLSRQPLNILDASKGRREEKFRELVTTTFLRIAPMMVPKGIIALIVGEATRGGGMSDSSTIVQEIFRENRELSVFSLVRLIHDTIPDIRRSRRDLKGTKRETILVFQKNSRSPRSKHVGNTP